MKERILITLELKNKERMVDIDIPINIKADKLIEILNHKYDLGMYQQGEYVKCFLCRKPYVFVQGGKKIREFGLWDGSILTVAEKDSVWKEEESISPFSAEEDGYPEFIRSTRIKRCLEQKDIFIMNPTAKPQKNTTNILLAFIPALAMLALVILLRGVMGRGGSYLIFSVCSMSLGIITSCIGFFENKRRYKKKLRERKETYEKYINEKQQEIEAAREKERENLNQIYYSAEQEYKMVKEFSSKLFERSPEDEDFLHICIGNGELSAKRKIQCRLPEKLQLDDVMEEIPQKMREAYQTIENVPIVCSLKTCNALGIVGEDAEQFVMFKRILLDLCVRHYAKEVQAFLFIEESNKAEMESVRFFPHFNQTFLDRRNIGCDKGSCHVIYDYLYKHLTEKKLEKLTLPWDVIFVYDSCEIMQHPVSQYIEKASEVGASFIFFEKKREQLPKGCKQMIEMRSVNKGCLRNSENKEDITEFSNACISNAVMEEVAEILAPVYVKEVDMENNIAKNISLFTMLGVKEIEEYPLLENWGNAKVYNSMAAPIGVGSKGREIFLDIHEKAHGPHGLVAGTTGSGKSELLQSYILSMALKYPPSEVGFVIIDFKGGGMANQFARLPHLTGSITNIDASSMERSLKSIQAELRKRQEIFAETGVNHIDDYIRERIQHKNRKILPHLIMIVDEFAELKAQQPEFMKELISASRIGRSLGIHLILATQKPSGQVNEQIWSNSKFKMCLKVQSVSDSNEVLKSPLAAEIRTPGRCYVQVGNNEIFELFQSAYSGQEIEKSTKDEQEELCISQVQLSGERNTIFEQKGNKKQTETATQLETVVAYVETVVKEKNIPRADAICFPELSEQIPFPESTGENVSENGIFATVGILDDPEHQKQSVLSMQISDKNTMILGSSQSGKTNLLITMVRSIVEKYTPQEVNLYFIDFASMILKNFEKLKHCGGVVCSHEEEKLGNLFKMLLEQMEERRNKILAAGVGSFFAYQEAGYKDLPYIVVFIDNLTALKELYLKEDDILLRICREGIHTGISVVVANVQSAGIGYKYLSNFAERLALYCNDPAEYVTLLEAGKKTLPNIPGRCLVSHEKNVMQAQIFLSFTGEKEMERVRAMQHYIEERNAQVTGRASRIPVIPEILTRAYLQEECLVSTKPYEVVCGLEYAGVKPFSLSMDTIGVLPLSGGTEKLHQDFIKNVCIQLNEKRESDPVEVIIFDETAGNYKELEELSIVKERWEEGNHFLEYLTVLEEKLKHRYEERISKKEMLQTEPLEIVICANSSILTCLKEKAEYVERYKNILSKYAEMKVCFLWAGIENQSIPYSAPEVYRKMKEKGQFMVFEDIANIKVVDVSLVLAKRYKKKLAGEEGYFLHDGTIEKIKFLHI